MKRSYSALLLFLVFGILASGCGTAYRVAMGQRSIGTQAKDQKITMAIRQKFIEDKTVKYLDISTYCYNGHVYLVGEYDSLNQKNQSMRLAREVEGVKSVTDHFLPKKKEDPCGIEDNLAITAKAKAKLVGDKGIWSTNIKIKALQCNVILLGIVGSKDQIRKAVAHAESVEGVRSVKSFLKSAK